MVLATPLHKKHFVGNANDDLKNGNEDHMEINLAKENGY